MILYDHFILRHIVAYCDVVASDAIYVFTVVDMCLFFISQTHYGICLCMYDYIILKRLMFRALIVL